MESRLIAALAGPGWGVVPEAVPTGWCRELAARARELDRCGEFRPGAIGVGRARAVHSEVRGDRICWLHVPVTGVEIELLAMFENLRIALNRELQLGVQELECHYAIYPVGAGYQRHCDRSPRGAERVVTVVLYLNEGWEADDGGQLRLYAAAGPAEIAPRAGALVAFLSERFEHEVRPTRRERVSLSGWFRRRAAP